MDLTALRFDDIPNAAYDVILMAHVIEHLHNGDEVLRGLAPKLRPGGMIYVEFPGPRSLRLPSKRGTLNFWDDPTHVRVFTSAEVSTLLTSLGFQIVRSGVRRDWLRVALTPAIAVHSKWKNGYVAGGVFWDLAGFAEGVVAVKNGHAPAASPSMTARA
jgi:SAM-dependent methyltransferase